MTSHDGSDVDIVINATSMGLHEGDALPLPLDRVANSTVIAEIIMKPENTAWLAELKGGVLQRSMDATRLIVRLS